MISPWDRWYTTSCCLCCHVRTGTVILGIWYMLINAVVLLILLSALNNPIQYRYLLTNAELGSDFDVMDDANMCIATAISLLMILICGMATYGAYKQHAAWLFPFLCYQIFDFVLNTLVAISVVVYPNSIQDYLHQLPGTLPYKEDIMSINNLCLAFLVLLFVGCILSFKAYLIGCVWNCYRYLSIRGEVLLYVTTNDTSVLLPPYEEVVAIRPKEPPLSMWKHEERERDSALDLIPSLPPSLPSSSLILLSPLLSLLSPLLLLFLRKQKTGPH